MDKIVKECFDILQSYKKQGDDVNEEQVESLCFLIERVAKYVINGDRKKKREDMIDIDYIDNVLKNLIDQIQDK